MSRRDLQPYPVNVTLNIIQVDIDYGIKQDSGSCAIAHAIYRSFPDALRVRVNRKTISWSDEVTDMRYVYQTPRIADEEIIKPNDLGQEVKPRRFVLSGGEFRAIDHKETRHNRERARRLKHDNPSEYEKQYQGRKYERYVPEKDSL
jgi:hypothetical protein